MKLEKSFFVGAPPDRVALALRSAPFNEEAEEERDEVLSTRFALLEQGEQHGVFELQTTEYRRTKLGRIDRSGTINCVTRHRYDSRELAQRWTYQGVGSRWVTVEGEYRLTAERDGTRVNHDITVEVHIPLIGGQVAKLVAREFDQAARRFERLLTKHSL